MDERWDAMRMNWIIPWMVVSLKCDEDELDNTLIAAELEKSETEDLPFGDGIPSAMASLRPVVSSNLHA